MLHGNGQGWGKGDELLSVRGSIIVSWDLRLRGEVCRARSHSRNARAAAKSVRGPCHQRWISKASRLAPSAPRLRRWKTPPGVSGPVHWSAVSWMQNVSSGSMCGYGLCLQCYTSAQCVWEIWYAYSACDERTARFGYLPAVTWGLPDKGPPI